MIVRRPTGWSAQALTRPPSVPRRLYSALLDGLSRPVQSYVSRSDDPYLNLSVEHYLLQKSDPASAVLFLYVNRPSAIIGRNQNPWLEVNLALLNPARGCPETGRPGVGAVDLVRRRSGGGTVFHDEGNVNWTVICPSANFTRDKHAEMVVHALRSCGIDRARVNRRHDIVLDQNQRMENPGPQDTHHTPFQAIDDNGPPPLKVSGSAYKITRDRALHHGTCLLSSPNLNVIPEYLHSPAKLFLTARGVESVSSPVGNIRLDKNDFMGAVRQMFHQLYQSSGNASPVEVSDEWLGQEMILNGYKELKSPEWTYLQTPQFTVSSASEPSLDVDLELTVRHGAITGGSLSPRKALAGAVSRVELHSSLLGRRIHEIDSWEAALHAHLSQIQAAAMHQLSRWLEEMLPSVKSAK